MKKFVHRPNLKVPQNARPDHAGSVIDPPPLNEWRNQESAKTGVANTNQTQATPSPRVPDLPSEEELLLRDPYRKRTGNFTIQSRLVKPKPELAKKLKLLAAGSE